MESLTPLWCLFKAANTIILGQNIKKTWHVLQLDTWHSSNYKGTGNAVWLLWARLCGQQRTLSYRVSYGTVPGYSFSEWKGVGWIHSRRMLALLPRGPRGKRKGEREERQKKIVTIITSTTKMYELLQRHV